MKEINYIEQVARAIAFASFDNKTLKSIDPKIFEPSQRHLEMAVAAIREIKRFEFNEEDPQFISEYDLTHKEAKSSLLSIVEIILDKKPS